MIVNGYRYSYSHFHHYEYKKHNAVKLIVLIKLYQLILGHKNRNIEPRTMWMRKNGSKTLGFITSCNVY